MNEMNLQNSINRYNRKRNSYDIAKINSSIKNGKKSLPEVFIDLNNHSKKTKIIQTDKIKNKQEFINHIQITNFNDSNKYNPKNRKVHKKQALILKNLYATECLKDNKNVIKDYKAEIQDLREDNEKLKQQLKIYKKNDEYLNKKLFQLKQIHTQEISFLKESNKTMQVKLNNYEKKIKQLYEELIDIKKKKVQKTYQRNLDDQEDDIIICNTISSENNRQRIKGQLYSYRNRQDNQQIDIQKFKRITSPTSHSRGKYDKSYDKKKWFQQQRNILKKCQDRGQEAYYRTQYLKNNNSQFYY